MPAVKQQKRQLQRGKNCFHAFIFLDIQIPNQITCQIEDNFISIFFAFKTNKRKRNKEKNCNYCAPLAIKPFDFNGQ